jgi:hypothetical protein
MACSYVLHSLLLQPIQLINCTRKIYLKLLCNSHCILYRASGSLLRHLQEFMDWRVFIEEFVFKKGSHNVAQAVLELTVLLPQSPESFLFSNVTLLAIEESIYEKLLESSPSPLVFQKNVCWFGLVFGSIGVWTQDFMFARQAHYHLSHSTPPMMYLFKTYFGMIYI